MLRVEVAEQHSGAGVRAVGGEVGGKRALAAATLAVDDGHNGHSCHRKLRWLRLHHPCKYLSRVPLPRNWQKAALQASYPANTCMRETGASWWATWRRTEGDESMRPLQQPPDREVI